MKSRPPRWRATAALLLLAAACAGGAEAPPAPRPGRPRNLLLVVVDTLRADRLGCYGHDRATSPHLDALAADAVLFERAFAPSPYTAASHSSLFTSLYPNTHLVWNRAIVEGGAQIFPALSDNAVTLAEVLREAGFQTAAIADGGFVQEERGLAQGFDLFESRTLGVTDRVDRALRWLREERDPARPFFLFLHTYEVHSPYMPPLDFVDRFDPDYRGPLREAVEQARAWVAANPSENPINKPQELFFKPLFRADELSAADKAFVRTLYDAEIAFTDQELGRFLAGLREHGLERETAIVVTADHGEEFWEHDYWGHHKLWEETLHIPLIVRLPEGPRGLRRADPLDLVDLMPSLLDELGLPVPEMAAGRSIALGAASGPVESRPLVAQANHPFALAAFRYPEGKAIFFVKPDQADAVFDVAADPEERADLADSALGQELLDRARADRQAFERETEQRRERFRLHPKLRALERLSADKLAELTALGYIDAGGG